MILSLIFLGCLMIEYKEYLLGLVVILCAVLLGVISN
jgi:hypothetical protein